jgi:hypothetical protein
MGNAVSISFRLLSVKPKTLDNQGFFTTLLRDVLACPVRMLRNPVRRTCQAEARSAAMIVRAKDTHWPHLGRRPNWA